MILIKLKPIGKVLLSSLILSFVFVACTKSDPGQTQAPTTVPTAGPEVRGNETAGGGGDTKYLTEEETKVFMEETVKALYRNDFLSLQHVIHQSLGDIYSRLRHVNDGSLRIMDESTDLKKRGIEKSDVVYYKTYKNLLGFDSEEAIVKWSLFKELPAWDSLKDKIRTLNNSNLPYFENCKKLFPKFEESHKAWYSSTEHGLCFDSKKIQLDEKNKEVQFTALFMHELTHVFLEGSGISHKDNEQISRQTQASVYDFYESIDHTTLFDLKKNSDRVFNNMFHQIVTKSGTVCSSTNNYYYLKGLISALRMNLFGRYYSLKQLYDSELYKKTNDLYMFKSKYFKLFARDHELMKELNGKGSLDQICQVGNFEDDLYKDASRLAKFMDRAKTRQSGRGRK